MSGRTFQAGERVGGWILEARLGGGGFSEVWRARPADPASFADIGSGLAGVEVVALKIASAPAAEEFLRAEAAIAGLVQHPGIVRVLASEAHESPPRLVLEYVEGRSLREVLRDRRRL